MDEALREKVRAELITSQFSGLQEGQLSLIREIRQVEFQNMILTGVGWAFLIESDADDFGLLGGGSFFIPFILPMMSLLFVLKYQSLRYLFHRISRFIFCCEQEYLSDVGYSIGWEGFKRDQEGSPDKMKDWAMTIHVGLLFINTVAALLAWESLVELSVHRYAFLPLLTIPGGGVLYYFLRKEVINPDVAVKGK